MSIQTRYTDDYFYLLLSKFKLVYLLSLDPSFFLLIVVIEHATCIVKMVVFTFKIKAEGPYPLSSTTTSPVATCLIWNFCATLILFFRPEHGCKQTRNNLKKR